MRYPSPEEWKTIQGGEPLILESPSGNRYDIIHAYKDEGGEYSGTLAIVPTPNEQTLGSTLLHYALSKDDVVVPAVLLWDKHGKPCEERSGETRGEYPRLRADKVDAFIEARLEKGWKLKEILPPKPK
jgi:hypothetical protein